MFYYYKTRAFTMFPLTNKQAIGTLLCLLVVGNVTYLMVYVMEGFTMEDVKTYHVLSSQQHGNNLTHLTTFQNTMTTPMGMGQSTEYSSSTTTATTTETVSESIGNLPKFKSILAPLLTTDIQEQTSCKVKTNWNTFLIHPKVTSDLTYWNFTDTIKCRYQNVLNAYTRKTKFNFSFECSDKSSTNTNTAYRVNEAKSNNHIQVVPFGDECLLKFIENCCYDSYRVPNVVHYVMYQKWHLNFFEFVSFYSVIRFVRPCAILIHGDYLPTGSYWEYIRAIFPNIIHVRRAPPMIIGGKTRGFPEHSSDMMRLEALIKYGGIYLDLDTVLVKPIDEIRSFPCTMSSQSSGYVGSAFISSERNSSFVFKWHHGYTTDYRSTSYTYNAMTYPRSLAARYPHDIHMLRGSLSRPWYQIGRVVYDSNYKWGAIYGIHLFARSYARVMDEEKVKIFNSTIGSICRHILYGNKELCQD